MSQASKNTPLLTIKNLTKTFHIRQGFASQEFDAVDNATFTIDSDKPEIFAICWRKRKRENNSGAHDAWYGKSINRYLAI